MLSSCPHCEEQIQHDLAEGQILLCPRCGRPFRVSYGPGLAAPADETAEWIARGAAARCPACQQVVDIKTSAASATFVPHYLAPGQRKICPQSGKPVPAPGAAEPTSPMVRPKTSKDLSAYLTRDFVKVVSATRTAAPQIEELTLEYLDKSDRVRLQIDALRAMLGSQFRMQGYPATLQRPHLAIWANDSTCVIARKHSQGGYESMSTAEIQQVLEDLREHKPLFFV